MVLKSKHESKILKNFLPFLMVTVMLLPILHVSIDALSRNESSVAIGDSSGLNSPLFDAVEHNDSARVRALIAQGVDVNAVNGNLQETALHMASRMGHYYVVNALLSTPGINIDARNTMGQTPLHCAANGDTLGHYYTVQILLRRGAQINVADNLGYTPLHMASNNNVIDIVSLFIWHHANINALTVSGKTPLELAVTDCNDKGATARLLLNFGADANVDSLLFGAIRKCKIELVRELIDRGANINQINEYGDTPLVAAISSPERDDRDTFFVVRVLLDAGANFNIRGGNGCTPLLCAIATNKVSTARLLLDRGARIDVTDDMENLEVSPVMRELLDSFIG